MKRIIILFAALLGLDTNLQAQYAHFAMSGTIEFQRRVNAYALMQKAMNKDNEAWIQPQIDYYKNTNPQFNVLIAHLKFGDNKTLYTPDEADERPNLLLGDSPMLNQFNTIFTDLTSNVCVDQKKVFERTYLIKDNLRLIKWKITDETREIAGYSCRRANGIYLDSIYIVAFYTTSIPVPGGPESFHGLPGMILGVALPHENITWFATKVTETDISQSDLLPPTKGKSTNETDLLKTLKKASEDWGPVANLYVKGFML